MKHRIFLLLTALVLIVVSGCAGLNKQTPLSDDALMDMAQSSADSKVTALPELDATPDGADLVYIIDDVVGTATSKKITIANLLNLENPGEIGGSVPGIGNFSSVVIPQIADPSSWDFHEGTDFGGTYKHTLKGADYSADRTSAWPNFDIGFLNSSAVESDGTIGNNSVDYTKTTGSYKSSVLVGDPDSMTITTALHYGGIIIANSAGEDELAAVAVNMSLTLQADDTIIAIWNPNASDTIIRNGVSLAQGEALISDDTVDTFSIAVCVYRAANTWDCVCSEGMTEETP